MVFLEISQNLQKNTCASVSFSIKLQAKAFKFIKKRLQQKFVWILQNFLENLFYRTLPVAASDFSKKKPLLYP